LKKLFLLLVFTLTFTSLCFAESFSDVDKSFWAYEPISDMMERGILKGYPDGTFRPNADITRAEFAKILVSAFELKEDDNTKNIVFEDIDSSNWASEYVKIASNYLSAYNTGDGRLYYMPNDKAV